MSTSHQFQFRNEERRPICNQCVLLLDRYREVTLIYSDSVKALRTAMRGPDLDIALFNSDTLSLRCQRARAAIEHHKAACPLMPFTR